MGDHSLVDLIFGLTNCSYLSEVKYPEFRPIVIEAIRSLDIRDYTPKQWSYAVSYITGKDTTFTNLTEVEDYLKSMQP